jgi:D-apionolactonase
MSDTLASCESVSLGKLVLRLDRNGAFAREISVGGEELFRGIGFVVRDANWGTPVLTSDAILSRQNDRATVKSGGELDMSGGDLTWSAEWSITEGGLEAKGRASSVTGFHTNRTGFVVLHSLGATRGRPVKVFHPCGGIEETTFPDLVSPHQPFFDIEALEYTTATGIGSGCHSPGRSSRPRISAIGPTPLIRPTADRCACLTPIESDLRPSLNNQYDWRFSP